MINETRNLATPTVGMSIIPTVSATGMVLSVSLPALKLSGNQFSVPKQDHTCTVRSVVGYCTTYLVVPNQGDPPQLFFSEFGQGEEDTVRQACNAYSYWECLVMVTIPVNANTLDSANAVVRNIVTNTPQTH